MSNTTASGYRYGNYSFNFTDLPSDDYRVGEKVDRTDGIDPTLIAQKLMQISDPITITVDGVTITSRDFTWSARDAVGSLNNVSIHIPWSDVITVGTSIKTYRKENFGYVETTKLDKQFLHGEDKDFRFYYEASNPAWDWCHDECQPKPDRIELITQDQETTPALALTFPSSTGDGIVKINRLVGSIIGTSPNPIQKELNANNGSVDDSVGDNWQLGTNAAEFERLNLRTVYTNGVAKSLRTTAAPSGHTPLKNPPPNPSPNPGGVSSPVNTSPGNPTTAAGGPVRGWGVDDQQVIANWKAEHAGGIEVHGRTFTADEFHSVWRQYQKIFTSEVVGKPAIFRTISVPGHARSNSRIHKGYDFVPSEHTSIQFAHPGLYSFEGAHNGARMYFTPMVELANTYAQAVADGKLVTERKVINGVELSLMNNPALWMDPKGTKCIAILHLNPLLMTDATRNALFLGLENAKKSVASEYHVFSSAKSYSILVTNGVPAELVHLSSALSFPIQTAGEDHYHWEFAKSKFSKNGNISYVEGLDHSILDHT